MGAAANHDVLVVGGGPAGSCAAARLRQHGLRVLVVEKCSFPRFRIGESLLPAGNRVLADLGVLSKVEAGGFMPKYGAEFHRADGSGVKQVLFSRGLVPGLDRAFQVDRARFDTVLLDHARSLGAEVRLETTARGVESVPGGHRVTLAGPDGESTVTVPWVIDATGRETGLMSDQKRALEPPRLSKRMAIYGHFRGVARAAGSEGGNILIVRLEGGWAWLIPIDAERTSVGVVTTVEALRAAGRSPTDYFQSAVAGSRKLGELLAAATPAMEFHVTSDYSYFRRGLAEERLLLAGDAAGFFDPIFSSGVYLATWSGVRAADAVARAHAAGRALTAGERRRYTQEIRRHAGVFEKLIHAFYDDHAFDVFMCEPVPWDLGRGLTSIVAGHVQLTWPLWWRLHLFLLVCRLQRRWNIARPAAPKTEPMGEPIAG